jgi:3-oxoacyl-[acyl-carrier-protein] synthase III
MTVGIRAIAAYVPEAFLDLKGDDGARLNLDPTFVDEKTGFEKVARKGEGEETSDLAVSAIRGLLRDDPKLLDKVELLIVVTQNPDGHGLPHCSAIVHGKLDLPESVAAFDISLGCSGWVYALSIAKSFMEANNLTHGLVVTADPYSKVLDPGDRNTASLFGDAAAATWLTSEGPLWDVTEFVFGTKGLLHDQLEVDGEGILRMNGRGVFNFSATVVPKVVTDILAKSGRTLDDVDVVLLHQGSRFIVDTIGQRLHAQDRTPFVASNLGNTVSSTIPIAIAGGALRASQTAVACGFGVGLSWAAAILEKRKQ